MPDQDSSKTAEAATRDEFPLRCASAPWEGDDSAGWALCDQGPVRCRQVKASEIGRAGWLLDTMLDSLDEDMQEGSVSLAWGTYGDTMVSVRPGAVEAFDAWIDQWVEVRAYINEEPGQ